MILPGNRIFRTTSKMKRQARAEPYAYANENTARFAIKPFAACMPVHSDKGCLSYGAAYCCLLGIAAKLVDFIEEKLN